MVNRIAEMLLHYSEDTCRHWWTDDSLRMEICTFNRHFSGDNKTFPLQQVACILVTVLDSGDQYIGVMNNYIMVLMM